MDTPCTILFRLFPLSLLPDPRLLALLLPVPLTPTFSIVEMVTLYDLPVQCLKNGALVKRHILNVCGPGMTSSQYHVDVPMRPLDAPS